jgi:SPX domain protein involved in polyphosphate accumulation
MAAYPRGDSKNMVVSSLISSSEPPTPPCGSTNTDLHDRAGDELQSLSRFSKAQQTAFRKLLKKHKKWTGSTDLETEFNRHVLGNPSSFTNIDMNPLYTQYEDTLSALRTLYHERISGTPEKSSVDTDTQDNSAQIRSIIESSSSVEFDSYLSTSPLGRGGKNAVYWVHPDNIVELQILILQHARSFPSRTIPSVTVSPMLSRHNSITSSGDRRNSTAVEADTTLLVADDLESFIAHQSSSTFEKREETVGSRLQEAAVHARWTKSDDAIITAQINDRDVQRVSTKPKNVLAMLEPSSTTSVRKSSITQDKKCEAIENMRTWLAQQGTIKPLTTIASNRTRFAETATDSSGFILATLDKNIRMKKAESLTNSLEDAFSQNMSAEFPFAVLRVRQEGFRNSTLIKVLDQSHLVERVRGFSLEYHSVWYCCQPENVVPPFWVPLMQKDIRKVPTAASRRRAYNHDSSYGSQSTTPQMSTSTGSVGDRTGDLTAVEEQSPPRIRIPDQLATPPLSAFRKKRKSAYGRAGSALPKQAYWNEFDDPSGSEDEGAYVLYIDPNEVSSATKTWRCIRSLWSKNKPSDQEALLGHDGTNEHGMVEESVTSSDDEAQTPRRTQQRSYGTLNHSTNQVAGYNPQVYHQHPDWVTQMSATCLVASMLLLCIGYILVATGKRKLASEVDAGVVLAVASSLTFAVSGVGAIFGRGTPRWPIATLVIGILVADVAAASVLLTWAFG